MRDGIFRAILRTLALNLKGRGGLDLKEDFVDAFFMGVKLIAPHRRAHKAKTQDGRELR
ncbi:hypothetical protein [Corallococcus sp. 4LFB]|uniref:hypothetical protein n=1 Tax=Corallococcus sp. 4LFB TaxID=3383249 RepID=UPI0039756BB8